MTKCRQMVYITTVLLLLCLFPSERGNFVGPATVIADPGLNANATEGKSAPATVDKSGIEDKFISMPMLFIANQGQVDSAIRYYTQMPGGAIYLTNDNIVFDFVQSNEAASPLGTENIELMAKTLNANNGQRLSFSLAFIGAGSSAEITGQEKAETVINYYIGNDPQKWLTQIPTYREVLYKDIYPNIDLRLYGKGGAFTYDFIVHPSGNIDDIKLAFTGIDGLDINNRELTISTALGDMKQEQLKIYQGDGILQCEIGGDFRLLADNSYGFAVAQYDGGRDLVIDPCLMYSTYLSGSKNESGFGIVCDSNGIAYVAGATSSTDFCVRNPNQGIMAGPPLDAFLAKINTNGTGDPTLVFATYLGGNKSDGAFGLTLGPAGNVNIAGATASDNFPITPDAFCRTYRGGDFDCFFSIFNAASGTLISSTYFGGSGNDIAQDIHMGSDNCVYLTGSTSSSDFSTLNPFQATPGGFSDAFVIKLNNTGVVYSTYLGGRAVDAGVSVTGDASGCSYVVGITSSDNFPLSNAYQDHINGSIDLFITKLATDGQSLVYSTYLGGSGYDGFKGCDISVFGGIAVDNAGCAYITGITNSSDFPVQNAYQSILQGGFDAFLTKLSADGQSLAYSTHLGGSGDDAGTDVAVDKITGDAYVCGETKSHDFPLLHPIMKPYDFNGNIDDAFIVKITTDMSGDSSLAASTCFGGDWGDVPVAIALDSSSRVYITGFTNSWDLPQRTTNFGYRQTPYLGGVDVFIARMDEWAIGAGCNKPPYIPEITGPANFAGGVSESPTFSWTGGDPDGDVVTYWIWLNGAWALPCPFCTTLLPAGTATSFTLSPLLTEKRYVWRVIAVDEHGTTSYSPVRTFFTTKIPPSGITLDATNIEKVVNGDNVTYNATLNGRLDSLGSYDNATCWFTYQAFSTPSATMHETASFSVNSTGVFSQLVTGLESGYRYVFHSNIVPPGKEWNDGLMTRNTNFVVGLPAINGTGALEFKAMSGSITRIFTVDPATMPDVNKPEVTFPYGMLAYDIQDIPVGSTVKILLTFSSALPVNTQYWKCDNVTGWQNITTLLGHNDGDNILELNITDGGLGDADGVANGIIIDPGGPGIPVTPIPTPMPTPTPTPTPSNPLIGTGIQTSHGSSITGATITTQPVSLPNILVQSASLSAQAVTPGTPVTVTTDIINKSTVNGNKKITLYVNGQVEKSQSITVNSGSSTQLTFSVSRSEPGDYNIYVDGVPAGSFKVAIFRESDIILILSITLLAMAFLVGLFMLRRRRQGSY